MKFVPYLIITLSVLSFGLPNAVDAAGTLSAWWPTDGAHVRGVQPFKAVVDGTDVATYDMYWQVDGGSLNPMQNSWTDYQHKEASVDVTNWSWHGAGPYAVTFVAKQNGSVISQKTVSIYTDNPAPPATIQLSTPISVPSPVAPAATKTLPVSAFYVDPQSSAAAQAAAWSASHPTDASKMQVLAHAPTAKWFGEWSGAIGAAVSSYVKAADGKTAVMVAYDIPQRDCGGYSAGGSSNYLSWISSFASGIGSANAIVILEPDALAQATCLSSPDQGARYELLSKAVRILKSNPNTKVYLDAGHAGWVDTNDMAHRLALANVSAADGFSLNVSNYDATASESTYGSAISDTLGGKHFVIDTSRNGNGSNGQWCNASGRAIGTSPTAQTGNAKIDAYLWIKTPGESDGNCNGGPSAGTWWPEYALGLVQSTP